MFACSASESARLVGRDTAASSGMPAAAVFHQLWPLALIAVATLGLSAWLVRARME